MPKTGSSLIDSSFLEATNYLARTSLYYLDKEVLGFTDFTDEVHKPLCNWVQNWDNPRKILLMSRFSFKTCAVSVGYSIQCLLNDPNYTILLVSQERNYAVDILNQIKGKMEEQLLIDINGRPFHGKSGWKEYEIWVNGRTDWSKRDPSIGTAGIDSIKAGPHPLLVILDDPETEANTSSTELCAKLKDSYRRFSPMLGEKGRMIIIGTPYAFDGVYMYILETPAEWKRFDILFGQAQKDTGTLIKSPKNFVHLPPGPEGTYLVPKGKITPDFLADEEARDPVFHASQYQVSIISGEAQEFKKDYFRYYLKLPDNASFYVTLDPAYSRSSTACYTSIVVAAVDQLNNIFIVDLVHERLTPDEIVDKFYQFYDYYRPFKMGVEANAIQTIFQWVFDKAAVTRGVIPIFPLKERVASKDARIRSLLAPYQQGRVYHLAANEDKNSIHPSQQILESQLLRFPASQQSVDAIDAECMLMEIIDVYYKPRSKRKNYGYEPIDSITGY